MGRIAKEINSHAMMEQGIAAVALVVAFIWLLIHIGRRIRRNNEDEG